MKIFIKSILNHQTIMIESHYFLNIFEFNTKS